MLLFREYVKFFGGYEALLRICRALWRISGSFENMWGVCRALAQGDWALWHTDKALWHTDTSFLRICRVYVRLLHKEIGLFGVKTRLFCKQIGRV